FRLVHHAHPAAAEFLDDPVVRYRLTDQMESLTLGVLHLTNTSLARQRKPCLFPPATKLNDPPPVTFGRSSDWCRSIIAVRFSFCRCLRPRLFTLIALTIESLRHRRRSADITQPQHFDLEVAAIVGDSQLVADLHLTCRLQRLAF